MLQIDEQSIQFILERIAVINGEIGGIETSIAILQTDVEWLKKFFFIISIATIGTLVTALWNVILHKKNGGKK